MDASVIVVGAGPAGLMLAGELRLAGVDVVVLEKRPRRSGESRGLGFTARTMEVFDQRGLLPAFGSIEISTLGHFGGQPVDFAVLEGAHFGVKGVPQSKTESVLEEWAERLGAEIRRGHAVQGIQDDGDSVSVEVAGPDGTYHLRTRYLVGCDGGRSTVRKAAGFDFPGTSATREMFLADIKGCDITPRPIGETVAEGMVMAAPLGDGVDRIIVCERGAPPRQRDEAPPFPEVAAAWQRLTGQDISHGTPVWVSAFGDPARQVSEYQRGRVLLAGDSAHVHLPAGGQGMNTSVQDSVNLGWKLGAVVTGRAPESLLRTYQTERHPVGSRLLTNTQAQGMLFLSGDEMQPVRDVLAELIRYDVVSRHLAGMVSGLDIRYDVGAGEHPLLGMRMPHLEVVVEGVRKSSAELFHPARGVLLDLADDADVRMAVKGWADRVDVHTAVCHDPTGAGPLTGLRAVLVRPDGYVAWLSDGGQGALAADSVAALEGALEQWFGPAR